MIISEKKVKIGNAEDIAKLFRTILETENEIEREKEHFWAVGLNVKNVIQYIELVSLGSLSVNIVHPRETFRLAIYKGVASIIVVHNHPSGDSQPSYEDNKITERLKQAGDIIGIKVIDHIIIANDNDLYYSYTSSGVLCR